jgi:hypothetical protein
MILRFRFRHSALPRFLRLTPRGKAGTNSLTAQNLPHLEQSNRSTPLGACAVSAGLRERDQSGDTALAGDPILPPMP